VKVAMTWWGESPREPQRKDHVSLRGSRWQVRAAPAIHLRTRSPQLAPDVASSLQQVGPVTPCAPVGCGETTAPKFDPRRARGDGAYRCHMFPGSADFSGDTVVCDGNESPAPWAIRKLYHRVEREGDGRE